MKLICLTSNTRFAVISLDEKKLKISTFYQDDLELTCNKKTLSEDVTLENIWLDTWKRKVSAVLHLMGRKILTLALTKLNSCQFTVKASLHTLSFRFIGFICLFSRRPRWRYFTTKRNDVSTTELQRNEENYFYSWFDDQTSIEY